MRPPRIFLGLAGVVLGNTNGPKCDPDAAYSTRIFKDLVDLLAPDTPIPKEFK